MSPDTIYTDIENVEGRLYYCLFISSVNYWFQIKTHELFRELFYSSKNFSMLTPRTTDILYSVISDILFLSVGDSILFR